MAVKFQPVKIPQSGLSNIPVVNGQLIYCYDTGRVFVDTQVGRLQQGISTVSDSSSLPAIASDKLYFIKQSNKLVSFVNGAWKEVNSQEGTYLPLSGGTMTGGINSSASNVLQVLGKNIISQQKSGQYPAIAGDHVAYAGSQAEKGIVFKGQVKDADVPSNGLIFYVPLAQQKETAQSGQTLTYNGTITHQTYKGIPCAHFSTAQISSQLADTIPAYPMTISIWAAPDTTQSRALWSFSYDMPMMYYNGKYHVYSPDVQVAEGNIGQWHHIVWCIEASRMSTYYFDGVKKGTVATSASTFRYINIGYRNGDQPQWKGYLAGFRVYNRALSAEEVQALTNEYNRGMQQVGFLMQFTDSKYSFKPTSDKYDDSDPSNFWTGKAVKSYADSNYLSLKNGGTVTGLLKLRQRPQLTAYAPVNLTDTTITTKADVTSLISQSTANYLPIAGGTMTGNITLSNTSMDLTNADTANIAVTGKAVTDYVDKKIKNYLPLSGGTVTGALTVNGTTAFGYRPSVTQTALSDTSNQYNLTTFKDLTTYVTNYTTKYLPLSGGVLTGPIQVIDGTDTSMTGDVLRWSYRITEANRCSLYSNVGTFYRQHSDSQTVTKYGRGVQLVPGFFDNGTRLGLYLTNYSSKASISQIKKGIQIINTGTLYHSQDSTDGWDGFNGDVSINFTNKQNTNSIAQWGPVKDFVYQQKRFLFQDCGAGDVAIGSDDVIYYCQPTNTSTKYTLPTQPDNPAYTHVRRLYVRLWSGYAFSIQGPVTWYQVPDFAPGFTYRLVFQWDRATMKWLGNMFWSPQAIS